MSALPPIATGVATSRAVAKCQKPTSPNPAITSLFDYFVGSDRRAGQYGDLDHQAFDFIGSRCRARTVGIAGSPSTVERRMPNGRHTIDQPDEGNHDAGRHG